VGFYDFSVPAEAIVDAWDYELSKIRYMGDAFPSIWPNFGPGIMAGFIGAEVEPRQDTTWFHPRAHREVPDLHLEHDAQSPWLERIKDVCRAAVERWEGQVQVGMTDLGGSLDVLSTFRPAEELLLDLYDHPDDVKRLVWEIHDLWFRYFDEINDVLQPANPGYTAWTPIFSSVPYYMLQCDFCYMIGPDMFDEFVKPELAASCRRLGNPFYHLDGPGQLPHLDSLLEIEELKGVQWVPGAGVRPWHEWPEVYREIHDAGKLIQTWGAVGSDELDVLAKAIGGLDRVVVLVGAPVEREAEVREWLARYGVPV
jgi:5-methyltetrahydrofolate--homocysteine methyltransferase